ncbi:EAL and modified HD-GYP domain-containing signal transduction protein [Streptohalobacillus salinus]|uniref:EAL and modified HD-GYP domain-containing signal transduction protein n=1 Tax=Streptohalobacillus salinus TaxID=621096 RepID=A0A2V3VXI3_9BACI|nr:HDOD domain-containing protein [Streptohalobacillus salinus]PXW86707.1 EAL and modified HD-GYP domain-containing signal transduction protein [Streptohalobacillus salinus]
MSKVLLAKQPILDRNRTLFGYELLYRTEDVDQVWDGELATVEVMINAYLNIGIEQLAGHYPVFINFTENLLTEKHLAKFAPKDIVIELLEDIELTETVKRSIKQLAEEGYRMALDDVTPALYRRWHEAGVMKYLTYAKVDFMETKEAFRRKDLADTIKKRYPSVSLIAEKVETLDEFDEAVASGYHLFQGFFFMKPELMESFEIPAYYLTYIDLIKEIDRMDFQLLKFAGKIQNDLSLSYKLLKLINSPAYRRIGRINSIERAVVLLGQAELKKWLYILALRDSLQHPALKGVDALVKSSYYRAKMCENLAEILVPEKKQEAFLVGYFSQLPAILRQPQDQLMAALSLDEIIEDALNNQENALTDLYRLTVAYERVDWPSVEILTEKLGLDDETVFQAYRDANQWIYTLFD